MGYELGFLKSNILVNVYKRKDALCMIKIKEFQ